MKQEPKRATVEDCQTLWLELIAIGAVGHERAIPRREVLQQLRQKLGGKYPSADRVLREIMATAPEYGIPLASCNDGYYVIACPEDVEACVRDLRSRAGEMCRRIQALEALELAPERRLF